MSDKDDGIIDLKPLAVIEKEADIPLQATITNTRDGDKSLDNMRIDAPRANKDAAMFALTEYLVARSGHAVTKQVFRAVLQGLKPSYKKESAIKHKFVFHDDAGHPINAYTVILIEL